MIDLCLPISTNREGFICTLIAHLSLMIISTKMDEKITTKKPRAIAPGLQQTIIETLSVVVIAAIFIWFLMFLI
jgi:hypothetical protein